MTAAANGGRWLVVHAKAGEEFLAEQDLRRHDYEVFLPWVLRDIAPSRIPSRRPRVEKRAYFSRYVFVFVEAGKSLYRISKCMGVVELIRNGDGPLVAPAEVIERLRALATATGFIDIPVCRSTWRHSVKAGQIRTLRGGPFDGVPCEVHAVDKAGVADVFISIFGRSTMISVPVAGLVDHPPIHPNGGAMPALQHP